jgi:formylglycine-generating enzyme required for sulfatase activity
VTQVFISHSSQDDDFVTRLAADLRAAGLEPWVDHEDILPGANWDESVAAALRTCTAMVLVLTPLAVESDNVTDEWSYFLDEKKPVYPVIRETCEIPFRLRRRQYVDFTRGGEQALAELLKALSGSQPTGAVHESPRQKNADFERLPFEPETVVIPAGSFLMGSTAEQVAAFTRQGWDKPEKTELPQHTVTLPGYRIGKYPVTVEEYREFIRAGGYAERRYWTGDGWENAAFKQPAFWDNTRWAGNDRFPVVGVSWYEAYAYCRWLAEKTGRPYRLPTEAEWEKAARGTDGRIYPWGNEWDEEVCNTAEYKTLQPTPVGIFSPAGDSPYGGADMAGNVWEWCLTQWRESYQVPADDDPKGDAWRTMRGGSWNSDQNSVRCASRSGDSPLSRDNMLGFRVVLASSHAAGTG